MQAENSHSTVQRVIGAEAMHHVLPLAGKMDKHLEDVPCPIHFVPNTPTFLWTDGPIGNPDGLSYQNDLKRLSAGTDRHLEAIASSVLVITSSDAL